MAEEMKKATIISDRWAYLWFVIGLLLSLFSTGQWNIPLVAWVQPIFFIRFMRTQRWWVGFILVWLATYVTGAVAWYNILGAMGSLPFLLITIGFSLLLSGQTAAVIVAPIAIAAAAPIGVNPRALAMAVATSSSPRSALKLPSGDSRRKRCQSSGV